MAGSAAVQCCRARLVILEMRRFDVWLVALDPTVGREIQKTRPCVIVSPDEMNQHLGTVLAVPMTTGSRPAAFRVPVTFQGKTGLLLPDQMRAVDKARFVKRLGRLDTATAARLSAILQEMFADPA
jgi:mRNA interferase MazF